MSRSDGKTSEKITKFLFEQGLSEVEQRGIQFQLSVPGLIDGKVKDTNLPSIIRVYNVKDSQFGAMGDGETDDTVAIQSAIDYVYANGGGTIYFPNGIYNIGGDFKPVTGNSEGYFTQLEIPPTDDLQGYMPTVRFLGESAPSRFLDVFTNTPPPSTGAILLGRSTGNDYKYSMIASGAITTSWGQQSYTKIQFDKLTVRLRSKNGDIHIDPQMCAIEMRHAAMLDMEYVRIDTESPSMVAVNPQTGKFTTALSGPKIVNFADYNLRCVDVQNVYLGFGLSEHATLTDCHASACYVGFQINQSGHPLFFNACKFHWCNYGVINVGDVTQVFGTFQFERYSPFGGFGSKWFDGIAEIAIFSGNCGGNVFIAGALTGGTKVAPIVSGVAPNLSVVDMWTGNIVSNYQPRLTVPTYPSNASAISGGLIIGRTYKTSTGELRIVV